MLWISLCTNSFYSRRPRMSPCPPSNRKRNYQSSICDENQDDKEPMPNSPTSAEGEGGDQPCRPLSVYKANAGMTAPEAAGKAKAVTDVPRTFGYLSAVNALGTGYAPIHGSDTSGSRIEPAQSRGQAPPAGRRFSIALRTSEGPTKGRPTKNRRSEDADFSGAYRVFPGGCAQPGKESG